MEENILDSVIAKKDPSRTLQIETEEGSTLEILEEQPISSGNEKKTRLKVKNKDGNTISLVKKEIFYEHRYNNSLPKIIGFDETVDKMSPPEVIKFTWEHLKDNDLPVISDLQIVNGEQAIVMPDLEADGSVLYDSKVDLEDLEPPIKRLQKPTDQIFTNLDFNEIEEKAVALAKQATKANIQLPLDGEFHLKLDVNGNWSLIVLDLARVTIWGKPNDNEQQMIQRLNLNNSRACVKKMKEISEGLQQAYPDLKKT